MAMRPEDRAAIDKWWREEYLGRFKSKDPEYLRARAAELRQRAARLLARAEGPERVAAQGQPAARLKAQAAAYTPPT